LLKQGHYVKIVSVAHYAQQLTEQIRSPRT